MKNIFISLLMNVVGNKLAELLSIENIRKIFDNITLNKIAEYKVNYRKEYRKDIFSTFSVVILAVIYLIFIVYNLNKFIIIYNKFSIEIIIYSFIGLFGSLPILLTIASFKKPIKEKANILFMIILIIEFFALGALLVTLLHSSYIKVTDSLFLQKFYIYQYVIGIVLMAVNYLIGLFSMVRLLKLMVSYIKIEKSIEKTFDRLIADIKQVYDYSPTDEFRVKLEDVIFKVIEATYEDGNLDIEKLQIAMNEFSMLTEQIKKIYITP